MCTFWQHLRPFIGKDCFNSFPNVLDLLGISSVQLRRKTERENRNVTLLIFSYDSIQNGKKEYF